VQLKYFFPVLLLFVVSCSKTEDVPKIQIDIRQPANGFLISGDTLAFVIGLRSASVGLLKVSFVNEDGVSILNPKIFNGISGDTSIIGYFLIDNLDYAGSASLVAMWLADGLQTKKSVRGLLSSATTFSDAFVLYKPFPSDFRLIHLLVSGIVRLDIQNSAIYAQDAIWSAPAQTLALLTPDRRSVIGLKHPFIAAEYTLQALSSPHEIAWISADGSRFWLAEKSGNLRVVRAIDGQTLITINGSPDSLPYAISHCNQYSSVAFLSGANKHTVKVFYRQTGNLHSVWPLTGRVVDAAWKNEHQLNIAVRKSPDIDLYEVLTDPPSLKFLRGLNVNKNDSMFFVPGEAFLLRAGNMISKYSLSGQMLWQKELSGFPGFLALKSNVYWVQVNNNLLEINANGQSGRVLDLPENLFSEDAVKVIFAPIKSQ
jgi:hypothetical protein